MATRRQARAAALQLLYQSDLNPDTTDQRSREALRGMLDPRVLQEFAWELYTGTLAARDELDAKIQGIADNWDLARMAATDRNVLRMGVFEMQNIKTPAAVVIDECVELAKEYGDGKSGPFVNGILDQLSPASAAG